MNTRAALASGIAAGLRCEPTKPAKLHSNTRTGQSVLMGVGLVCPRGYAVTRVRAAALQRLAGGIRAKAADHRDRRLVKEHGIRVRQKSVRDVQALPHPTRVGLDKLIASASLLNISPIRHRTFWESPMTSEPHTRALPADGVSGVDRMWAAAQSTDYVHAPDQKKGVSGCTREGLFPPDP